MQICAVSCQRSRHDFFSALIADLPLLVRSHTYVCFKTAFIKSKSVLVLLLNVLLFDVGKKTVFYKRPSSDSTREDARAICY